MKLAPALAFAALLGTAGCARESAVNPVSPMWRQRPSWSMDLVFRRQLVGDASLAPKAGSEKSIPAIDVRHGRVFVGASDRGLYALRASDGSTLFRFQAAGSVQSEPLYDDERDVVYFGADDAALYAVRARDGGLIFRYRVSAEVQRRPVLARRPGARDLLVFADGADCVYAIDAETGAPRWKRLRTPALGLESVGHAGISIDGERVYAAFSTGRVVAYDLGTGADRWPEVDLSTTGAAGGDEGQRFFDVDTTPIVLGDRVFVANVSTGVFALDATSGGPIWRRPEIEGVSWVSLWHEDAHVSKTGTDVPATTLLLAASGTKGLWALDPKGGEVRWRRAVPRGAISYPVEIAGALLVTTSKSGLFLLEPNEGRVIDGIDPGTGFAAGAAAYGTRAFVLTNGGVLLGLQVIAPALEDRNPRSW